jgi:hypothetical protein
MKNCVHFYILPTIRMIPGSPNAIVQARHLAFAQGPQFSTGQVTQVRTGWIILVVPWEVHSDPAWKTHMKPMAHHLNDGVGIADRYPKPRIIRSLIEYVHCIGKTRTRTHTHIYILYNVFIHIYILYTHIIYIYYCIYIRNSIHNSTHPPPLPLNFCQDIG